MASTNHTVRQTTDERQKRLGITAVWRNGGGSGNISVSASNKHLCLIDSEVLRKPQLRQSANR